MVQMFLFMKHKQTHRHRKQTYGYQRGKEGRDNMNFVLKNKGINNSTRIMWHEPTPCHPTGKVLSKLSGLWQICFLWLNHIDLSECLMLSPTIGPIYMLMPCTLLHSIHLTG